MEEVEVSKMGFWGFLKRLLKGAGKEAGKAAVRKGLEEVSDEIDDLGRKVFESSKKKEKEKKI